MICCRLHPDCSNTYLGWQDMSTKLKSFTIARVEAIEIQALPFFVYNEYAHLAQHNVPAGSFPLPSPHPLPICLRDSRSIPLTQPDPLGAFHYAPCLKTGHTKFWRTILQHRILWGGHELAFWGGHSENSLLEGWCKPWCIPFYLCCKVQQKSASSIKLELALVRGSHAPDPKRLSTGHQHGHLAPHIKAIKAWDQQVADSGGKNVCEQKVGSLLAVSGNGWERGLQEHLGKQALPFSPGHPDFPLAVWGSVCGHLLGCVYLHENLFSQHLKSNQLFRCYQATANELSRSTSAHTSSRAGPPGCPSWRNSTAWSFGSSTVGKYTLVYISDTWGECFLSWLMLSPCSRACSQQKRARGTGWRMCSCTTVPALPPHPRPMPGLLMENSSLSGLSWLPVRATISLL